MKKLYMLKTNMLLITLTLGFVISSTLTYAAAETDTLKICFADNTSGKDRKNMAIWVFINMSSHPELHGFSTVSPEKTDDLNKTIANLFTRLITQDCASQAKLAFNKDGTESMKGAFGMLGELSMQELLANPQVTQSFSGYAKYLDRSKFNALFSKE